LIEKLEPKSFKKAQFSVYNADFSNSKIELLDEKLFEKWTSIYKLNLSHNQIKVLPEKLLDNVKDNLRSVSFADNKVSEIGNNTFVNCSNLEHIDLRNSACFDVAFYGNRSSRMRFAQIFAEKHVIKNQSCTTCQENQEVSVAKKNVKKDNVSSMEYVTTLECRTAKSNTLKGYSHVEVF
jgi:hypothetical protein